ncbi:hypothetical protein M899_2582 [Bacteriovorax sp. BSW11_IV]|uniref:hypothetical protein n=1 Tax=Bacteriovorax sp. BSW11_IV TaxID=1353529 RepID=UPI00038A0187|nr:hypothetical protein [Bacteriovorax sp. BSW11_IV]EQC49878.1 hypothetical protein M899_2582 [Bacteriovorax sp. BSW11_IV]
MKLNVFDYACITTFLKDLLESKKAKNANFSLRSWSKYLGYNSPTYLSLCTRGLAQCNPIFIRRLFEKEEFSEQEKVYLTFLFLKNQCQDSEGLYIDDLSAKVKQAILEN